MNAEFKNRHQSQGDRSKRWPQPHPWLAEGIIVVAITQPSCISLFFFYKGPDEKNRKLAQGERLDATTDTVLICGYASRLPYSNVFAHSFQMIPYAMVILRIAGCVCVCMCVYKKNTDMRRNECLLGSSDFLGFCFPAFKPKSGDW